MKSAEFKSKYVKNGKILPNSVEKIEGGLFFNNNQITKIENLPEKIEGSLFLSNNQITKIENLPKKIGGSLNLSNNQITKISPFCLCNRRYILLKYFKEEELRDFIRKLIKGKKYG